MRKLVNAAVAAMACAVLTGCPIVKSVSGTARAGSFFTKGAAEVTAGQTLAPGSYVELMEGSSVTLTYQVDGKPCDMSFSNSFNVPGQPSTCPEKQDKKDQDKQDQQQEQRQQDQQSGQQPDASNGNSGISAPEVRPSSVPGYSGINAPAVTPTPVPQFSGGGEGGGGGFSGPPVVATGVPTYSRIMSVVTNPILTNTLAAIGAISVANEIRKQTDGNGDKPVSK